MTRYKRLSLEEREKIYLKLKDERSIFSKSPNTIWGDFIDGITASIGSKDSQLPFAKLNPNHTVSLFVEKSPEDPGDTYLYFKAKEDERDAVIEKLIKSGGVKSSAEARDIIENMPKGPALVKWEEISNKENAFKTQEAFNKCIKDPFIVAQLDYHAEKNEYKYIDNDKLLDFLGLMSILKYCKRIKDIVVESPQYLFLRTAIQIGKNNKERMEELKKELGL